MGSVVLEWIGLEGEARIRKVDWILILWMGAESPLFILHYTELSQLAWFSVWPAFISDLSVALLWSFFTD